MGDKSGALLLAVTAAFLLVGQWYGRGYDAFLTGAREGLQTGARMLPALTAMLLLIQLVRAGGLAALMEGLLGPAAEVLGVPREAVTTLLLRPLSGAGSLAALRELMARTGPDSRASRLAAVVVGSSETILYTLAVYLSAAGVKRLPKALTLSMLSWLAGVAAACLLC